MRVRHLLCAAAMLLGSLLPLPAQAVESGYFSTSDGVRLHAIVAGPANAPVMVLVPGWTMPAWIFQAQIQEFSRRYRVVALDPRGQGDSEVSAGGYDHTRRGQDIADLIARMGPRPVLLVGWSLGVLDSLAYVHDYGDRRLAGLVLVDNSVGEDPPPIPSRTHAPRGPKVPRDVQMRNFVRGMFRSSPGEEYLAELTATALRTPPDASAQLLNYGVPRSYWRDTVLSVQKPVLYIVRPRFAGQAANLELHQPLAETALFPSAGHALFVDEPVRFNALVQDFIRRRVWP
jgi:microsomal epoxide hydrolase